MSRPDDLTSLLSAGGAGDYVRMGAGVVQAWDQQTAQNRIAYHGSELVNVPILNTNEALLLRPGDVVAIQQWKSSYFIIGRVTIPGTAQAATALAMVANRILSAEIAGQGTGTSSAFGDLTGTDIGPAVTGNIGATGKAFVIVGATISSGGAAYSGGLMGFEVSGATSRAPSVVDSLEDGMSAESFSFSNSRGILVTGLNTGEHTFTAKYRSAVNGVSFTAENRNIIVFTL